MSCNSTCGPLVVTLLTGAPGTVGPAGPQGPQGPPGNLTSITGDLSLAAGETETVATVVGIQVFIRHLLTSHHGIPDPSKK